MAAIHSELSVNQVMNTGYDSASFPTASADSLAMPRLIFSQERAANPHDGNVATHPALQ